MTDEMNSENEATRRVHVLKGEVEFLLQQIDGNSAQIRDDIKRIAATDPIFRDHWLEVLELAADNRQSDIVAAYQVWKGLDPKQRPTPSAPLDVAALDYPEANLPNQEYPRFLGDLKDARAWRLINDRNQSEETR